MPKPQLEIYETLATDPDTPTPDGKYVDNLIKSAVPSRDLQQGIHGKSLFLLSRPTKKTEKIRKKKAKISRKEKLKLNLLKVPKTGWNYDEFEPLRVMWLEYMLSYLNLDNDKIPRMEEKNWTNFHVLLGKADYHGAEMTVVRSKCPSLVGISGTCILDTKNTFRLLSKDNKARIIPKKDSIFKLHVKNLEITIFGKYFATRPADRSARKFKTPMILDL